MKVENLKQNLDLVTIDNKSIYLVGTAHVSNKSVELALETINKIKPDSVCVELCESRYSALNNKNKWDNTDIVKILKKKQGYLLISKILLSAWQKKIADNLDVVPGKEMIESAKLAKDLNLNLSLVDRDISTTLKRLWNKLGIVTLFNMFINFVSGIFTKSPEINEQEIENLKDQDALEAMINEMSGGLPEVKEVLIDERDLYLAHKIKNTDGESIVAIIGAGHIPGIIKHIKDDYSIQDLETIPAKKKYFKIIAWLFPIAILAIFFSKIFGSETGTALDMASYWFYINSFFAAFGVLIARGHILTIIVAFIASPFTSLVPIIGVGMLAALVEAMIRKPKVNDFENIINDLGSLKGWYKNRVGRILLVLLASNFFGSIATILGSIKIFKLW